MIKVICEAKIKKKKKLYYKEILCSQIPLLIGLHYGFNYGLHSVSFCIGFRCTAWWLDNHVLSKVVPRYFKKPPGHIHCYSNITDHLPYGVIYTSVTIL